MGFADDGLPGTINTDALAAAELEFEKMAEEYPDWVQGHIDRMYEAYNNCGETPQNRNEHFTTLAFVAHDMKGQGGTFGYDLISFFGRMLFDYIEFHKNTAIKDNHVEIVGAHIDAIKAVIAGRITGNGGAVGAALVNSLEKAKERYADKSKT